MGERAVQNARRIRPSSVLIPLTRAPLTIESCCAAKLTRNEHCSANAHEGEPTPWTMKVFHANEALAPQETPGLAES